MQPRVARSSVNIAKPKSAKNKNRKRQLDAYAIASHSAPDKVRIRKHRLGESRGEEPRTKRRRLQGDHEDSEGHDEVDSARRRQERNVTKGTWAGVSGGLDEDVEEGSDSEGNEWTLGGLAEADDDSDLDSDEAFGESDEEKFEGFTFRGSSSGKAKPTKRQAPVQQDDADRDVDLDEAHGTDEDEEDEEDFGEEGVDLATMLNDDDEKQLGGKDTTTSDMSEESDGELSDDNEDDEQSEGVSEEADDEDDADKRYEERNARLQDFIEALDERSSERKPAKAAAEDDGLLTVEDLLEDADSAPNKEALAILKPKKKRNRVDTLTAPLPKRQQDKIDRAVATQEAKKQLDRWRDTVIENRRAEFLSFPLRDPDQAEPIGKDRFVPANQEAPRTELEASIRKIMEESGIPSTKTCEAAEKEEENALMKAEELATNKMPVEEVMRRRAELRRTRALLFREEIKSKRIAKIKSKSYRRVHRKERERNAEKERALLDPEGLGMRMDANERERADKRRAEARMGAKHKNSKWARSLAATDRTAWDEVARNSVHEQARRNEELRKRIAGRDVPNGSDASFHSEDDDGASDDGDENISAMKQLDRLSRYESDRMQKGIGGMKFMRAAEERRRLQNDEDVERIRKDLTGEESNEEDQEDEELGRAIFGPRLSENEEPMVKTKRPELEEGDISEDEYDEGDGFDIRGQKKPEAKRQPNGILKKTSIASGLLPNGPAYDRRILAQQKSGEETTSSWLTGPAKRSKKIQQVEMHGEFALNTDLRKLSKPTTNVRSMIAGATDAEEAITNGAKTGNTNGWTTATYKHGSDNEASDSETETENPILSKEDQRSELHRRAFASDDVQLAFDAEKAEAAASEDDKETSTHLPGWGSWAGSGLSKSTRKVNARQRHNPLYKTKLPGTKPADRKDAKLENVIISERQERKGMKYLAPVLPHEFERKEQYERSLRVPVGPEWTTKEVFQRGTRPRVVVKPGVVVEAMERPLM